MKECGTWRAFKTEQGYLIVSDNSSKLSRSSKVTFMLPFPRRASLDAIHFFALLHNPEVVRSADRFNSRRFECRYILVGETASVVEP